MISDSMARPRLPSTRAEARRHRESEVTRLTTWKGKTHEYWSRISRARFELIVPGPHGSYSLPQTIAELKRILKLHVASRGTAERVADGTWKPPPVTKV